jgi:hypothetical protein
VQREMLGITLYSHQDLETLLTGFNVAYNGRRQRVLNGRSPDTVLRERLKAKPELAKPATRPPDPDALPKALKVVADAKEVSHPDTGLSSKRHGCESQQRGGRDPHRAPHDGVPRQLGANGAGVNRMWVAYTRHAPSAVRHRRTSASRQEPDLRLCAFIRDLADCGGHS